MPYGLLCLLRGGATDSKARAIRYGADHQAHYGRTHGNSSLECNFGLFAVIRHKLG